jgi:polyisoprenoid-binding protein YceI
MTTTLTEQTDPPGTWTLDKVHSTVGYAVRHSGLSLFKGGLTEFDASLVDGVLRGSADVAASP